MSETPSDNLLLRAQRGEPGAFELFYERFHEGIFRFLYYRLGNQQAAEDLTSETFLRLIKALPDYRAMGLPPGAWAYQVARNLAVDYFRKERVRSEVMLEDQLLAGDDDPPAETEKRLTHVELLTALKQLGEDQREVIVMRFVSGLPLSETAQAMNRSEDAVKGLQHRALMTLRRFFTDDEVKGV